jgi:hypothetical protein
MEIIKIGSADIFIDVKGERQAKVTVSDTQFYSSTYYWGSMGCGVNEFLTSINSGYFADKMCRDVYEFCPTKSVRNVRKYIREEMKYELPWYEFMSAQKELREKLKQIEQCCSQDQFVNEMYEIHESLFCFDLDFYETRDFKKLIQDHLTCEPWHFIGQTTTNEYRYFERLHGQLKKELKKSM